MYEALKHRLLRFLEAPTGPPEPPPGTRGEVEIFRAAPNFLKLRLIAWALGFAGAIVGEIVFIIVAHYHEELGRLEGTLGWVLLGITLVASVGKYFLVRLDYDMRYYVVGDNSLRIREGVILIHESTFTYANVQNLRIVQGPLERLLRISNLVVETAGGAGAASRDDRTELPFRRGHQGVIRGVADAPQVRDRIQTLLKEYRDAGLGDPEDRHHVVAAARRNGAALSPAALERLREIRDELHAINTPETPATG